MRTLIIAALVFFSLPLSVNALSCGTGGTCKSSCSASETWNIPMSSVCPSSFEAKCCVTTASVPNTTNQPNGAGCLRSSECISGYCDTSEGVCKASATANTTNQPNGAGCLFATDCASGYCSPTTGTCTTRPPADGSAGQSGNSSGLTNPGSAGQSGNSGQNVTLLNPLQGGASLESFLNSILDFVIRIGTIVVVFMMVYVGYLFVAARGNSTKIEEARTALLWTVVGALILLGAKAIAIGIEATVQALSVGR